MRISDVISWNKASAINPRNCQVLTDVSLKVNFAIGGITYRAGTRYASGEIEVQGGKVVSMRLQLGEKEWTDFALIDAGLKAATAETGVTEETEVVADELVPVTEPAVAVTGEDVGDDASPDDAVPATD